MSIPGSEMLNQILHVVSQSLLVPTVLGLVILLLAAFLELGGVISDWNHKRQKGIPSSFNDIIRNLDAKGPENYQNINLSERHKEIIGDFLAEAHKFPAQKETIARKILEKEELLAAKMLERTDLIAKLGPILGLMGTLIPLGPGLAALGQGDIASLAQAVVVAFDTTVAGLTIGGIAYVISKIRRRWYEEHISLTEGILEFYLGGEWDAADSQKPISLVGRR